MTPNSLTFQHAEGAFRLLGAPGAHGQREQVLFCVDAPLWGGHAPCAALDDGAQGGNAAWACRPPQACAS